MSTKKPKGGRMEELSGPLIVLGALAIIILIALKATKQKGDGMRNPYYDRENVIDVGRRSSSIEPEFSITERSLAEKRDKAIQKATRQATMGWRDRKELRRLANQHLLSLTRESTEDLRDALRQKLRSDLNVFVTAHEMRNMSKLENLRLDFEAMLTEAYAESSRHRMGKKMRALAKTIRTAENHLGSLRRDSIPGGNRFNTMMLQSYERMLSDTMREIESINVRMNQRGYQE